MSKPMKSIYILSGLSSFVNFTRMLVQISFAKGYFLYIANGFTYRFLTRSYPCCLFSYALFVCAEDMHVSLIICK